MLMSIYIFLRRVFIQCYLKYPLLLSSYPYLQKGYTFSFKTNFNTYFLHEVFLVFPRQERNFLFSNTKNFISFLVIILFKLLLVFKHPIFMSMCPICLYQMTGSQACWSQELFILLKIIEHSKSLLYMGYLSMFTM